MGAEVTASFAAKQTQRVTDLSSALAATVAQLDESRAQVRSLEDELVAARSLADDWRDIAVQLAATCHDLRKDIEIARQEGCPTSEESAHAQ